MCRVGVGRPRTDPEALAVRVRSRLLTDHRNAVYCTRGKLTQARSASEESFAGASGLYGSGDPSLALRACMVRGIPRWRFGLVGSPSALE